jgi:hypothetical protein
VAKANVWEEDIVKSTLRNHRGTGGGTWFHNFTVLLCFDTGISSDSGGIAVPEKGFRRHRKTRSRQKGINQTNNLCFFGAVLSAPIAAVPVPVVKKARRRLVP